jgi:hypothetical protein
MSFLDNAAGSGTISAMRFQQHYRRLSLGRRVAMRTLAAFLATFGLLRLITATLHFDWWPGGPFHYVVTKGGLHIHHLFWGVLLLMLTGFMALATRDSAWHLRIAMIFGIALGLTLDEFAMWLRLADVYWSPEGVESVKAAAVAAALLAVYAFGQPFWHDVVRDMSGAKVTRSPKERARDPRRL